MDPLRPCHRPAPRRALPSPALRTLRRAAPCHAVETSFDAGVEGVYDSNVTRGELRDDIRADGYVSANGGATLRWPIGDADAVWLSAGLRAAQYLHFTRLSFAAAEASAGWQRKLGVGLTAPWVAASATLAYESYRETLRDSDRLALQLSTGQRFSERLDGSLGYVYDRRYARHDDVLVPGISGAVWDVSGTHRHRAPGLRADRSLAARRQLFVPPRRRRRDDASATLRSSSHRTRSARATRSGPISSTIGCRAPRRPAAPRSPTRSVIRARSTSPTRTPSRARSRASNTAGRSSAHRGPTATRAEHEATSHPRRPAPGVRRLAVTPRWRR